MRFAALDGRRLLSAQSAQAGGQADACIVRHLGRCSVGVCVGVRVPLCRAVCPGVGVAGQNAACGVGGVFGGIADGAGGIPGSIAQILSGIAQIASGVVCHVLAHIALVVGGRAVAVQLTIFIGVGAGGVLGRGVCGRCAAGGHGQGHKARQNAGAEFCGSFHSFPLPLVQIKKIEALRA